MRRYRRYRRYGGENENVKKSTENATTFSRVVFLQLLTLIFLLIRFDRQIKLTYSISTHHILYFYKKKFLYKIVIMSEKQKKLNLSLESLLGSQWTPMIFYESFHTQIDKNFS